MLFRKKTKKIHQQIGLKIPKGFEEMEEAEKRLYYPIEDRIPQEAFINQSKDSIIGIRHTTDHFAVDQLEEYRQEVFDKTLKTSATENYKSEIIKTKKADYILISYNLMSAKPLFITTLIAAHQETMLFLSFSSPRRDFEKWEALIKEICAKIKFK